MTTIKNDYQAMTVYKASAGSGKTFTLAVRFIELLIQHPDAYKRTLAVTFTNKATEEMKHRILSQLFGLWKNLPDSKDYMERICDDLKMVPTDVSQNAGKALSLMLHDFNNFNIETIDAFFQKVLRNLAREMGLNANLRVELNEKEIEAKAVDEMIAELKVGDSMLKWILGYIEHRIEDDKKWNVIDDIKSFGEKITSDEYKKYAEALKEKFSEPEFFDKFTSLMYAIIKDADKTLRGYGEQFANEMAKEGFVGDDFAGKNGTIPSYFAKLQNGNYIGSSVAGTTVEKACDDPKVWVVKSKVTSNAPEYQFAQRMQPFLKNVEDERKAKECHIKSARAVLSHINELRLMSSIKDMMDTLNGEENRFLLGDTQELLHKMMKETDAPFIFEKIGGPLLNIMIDEFQDTSTIQWQNFRTLLLECISKDHSQNLIVGDVKQSIYRWRNGDWHLLHTEIANDEELTRNGFEPLPLNDNFRSEGNIIRFNNEFFSKAAEVDAEQLRSEGNDNAHLITEIYADVKQNIPEKKKEKDNGLVDITLLYTPTKKKNEEEEPEQPAISFDDKVKELVIKQLHELFDAGATDDSIGILDRKNYNLITIAHYLQEEFPEHTFVSDEAYKLEASMAVNIIIAAIRYLSHPNDILVKTQLAKLYQEKILKQQVSDIEFRDADNIDKYLPDEFLNSRTMLLTRPITDLAEDIFRIFNLKTLEDEAAYVMAFYDQLGNFTKNNTPDLELLLSTWEDSMRMKTVKGGDLKGVRLLTIHKSKGLEFDNLIIPNAGWLLDLGSTLWCETKHAPFSDMPVVPLSSKSIKDTVYNDDYMDEQCQVTIDNLNMLYVAFTRASKNLFVIAKNSTDSRYRAKTIVNTLDAIKDSPNLQGAIYEDGGKVGDTHFTYGKLYIKEKKENTTDNVFLHKAEPIEVSILQEENQLEFRQSNGSRQFVEKAGEDETTRNSYTSIGTIMHNVLARIKDASEVDKVLNDFMQAGQVRKFDPEMNRESLSNMIRQRIENNKNTIVNHWFSTDVEVFNECTITAYDEEKGFVHDFRPDRVVKDDNGITVIDYKFGKDSDSYDTQVRTYMHFLEQMGYKNVKGYLWYVYINKIKEVK